MEKSRLNLHKVLVVVATLAPLLLYEYWRRSPHDAVHPAPTGHFIIVSAASLLSAAFAVLIGVAGRSQRNVQVAFLSTAFMSLAFIFSLHGLSTPGFIIGPSPVPGIASQLSVLVATAWLALSSLSSDSKPVVWLGRNPGTLVGAWALVMIAVVAHGLLWPQSWRVIPVNSPPLAWIIAGATIALSVFSAVRYWRSYAFSRMPLPHAIVYASLWFAVVQWIMVTSTLWHQSWWLYHYLLIAIMLALLVGIFRQYVRGESLQSVIRGLFVGDPIKRLEMGLSPSVQALVLATEARDRYTAGHSYRVAVSAVRIGQELQLSPEDLRALAIGGLVHDVGKIEVPDHILGKRGPLTPEERAIIELHPVTGYRICRNVGFMSKELGVIRHHHERWDGTGYPDRLAGTQIPKLARILAVADVYDALTSARSYRGALSHREAYQIILSESGKAFDPECVRAWARLNEEGPVVESGEVAPWSKQLDTVPAS